MTMSATPTLNLPASLAVNLDAGALLLAVPAPIWAVVGGVIGAMFTHILATKREKHSWIKQRVYEAIVSLQATADEMVHAGNGLYAQPGMEWATIEQWQRVASEDATSRLQEKASSYATNLLQLRMLASDSKSIMDMVDELQWAQTHYYFTCLVPHQFEDDEIHIEDYIKPIFEAFSFMESKQDCLIGAVARKYWGVKVSYTETKSHYGKPAEDAFETYGKVIQSAYKEYDKEARHKNRREFGTTWLDEPKPDTPDVSDFGSSNRNPKGH